MSMGPCCDCAYSFDEKPIFPKVNMLLHVNQTLFFFLEHKFINNWIWLFNMSVSVITIATCHLFIL